MSLMDLGQLVQIYNLLGIKNPTVADQTTVMNFLKKIDDALATSTAQLGIDNPTTADRTTVMNFLKQVYDLIVTNTTAINTNVDAVDTSVATVLAQLGIDNPTTADRTTVMNFLKQIADSKIGAASPSVADRTTVMNFLKQVYDLIASTKGTPMHFETSLTPSTTTETDLINVTGSGVLREALCGVAAGSGGAKLFLKVYIDGVLKWNGVYSASTSAVLTGILSKSAQIADASLFAVNNTNRTVVNLMGSGMGKIGYPYSTPLDQNAVYQQPTGYFTLYNQPIPFTTSLRITFTAPVSHDTKSLYASIDYDVNN